MSRRQNTRRRGLSALALVMLGAMPSAWAWDAGYPDRPIRMIVPFAAGTGTDVAARAVAEGLGRAGVTLVVDNIPGANGILGAQQASKAAADGYTLFLGTSTTHAANAALYKKLPYDPLKDFEPISKIAEAPLALVVRPESPYRSAPDFLAAVKARRPMSFASSSGATRIAGEMLKTSLNGDLVNVPYKASPQALTDLMGGQIDFMVCDMGGVLQLIRTGRLRALAVTSSKRDMQLQDVPTFPEAGLKAFELMTWVGAFVPSGTPKPIVDKLGGMFRLALTQSQIQEKVAPMGVSVSYASSDDMRVYVRDESAKWRRAVQDAAIEPE